ncbi:MAG TPA: hemerythrin domain-containing protein [Streptosporangiaceae bacterium]
MTPDADAASSGDPAPAQSPPQPAGRPGGPRLPRRAVLLGAGGLAAAGVGAGITLAATSSSPGTPTWAAQLSRDEAQPPPNEDLMREHGLLVRILLIYRHVDEVFQSSGQLPATELHDAALIIHDYIEAFHEALEEAYVFPRLLRAGQLTSTVDTLLVQHGRGREQTQLILADTEAGGVARGSAGQRLVGATAAFVRMYEPHEAREDTVIYPAYRSLLSEAEIAELGERFAQLEREQFGHDGFPVMLARVAQIEQTLGIYDLNQFTPANVTPPPLP